MGIEVANKDSVIRMVEKEVKIRSVLRGTGGVGREVEVDDVQGRAFPRNLDSINLKGFVRKVI